MSRKVLIVDDSPISRKMLKSCFPQGHTYEIHEAGDWLAGLEKYKELRPDITFMDLTMPVMDGEQAFHMLHGIRPDTPVLLSSGFSATEVVGRLNHFGLAGFVRKPYTRKTLLREVVRLGITTQDLDFTI